MGWHYCIYTKYNASLPLIFVVLLWKVSLLLYSYSFFLLCSSIPLSIGSCWVSLLSVLRDSMSIFTHCIILSLEFSCSSPFSLWNLSLDSASTCGMVFPLTYIMSKSNAMILIAHLKIVDNVTLGNFSLGLNKNSRSLWSDSKRNFLPNKIFCPLSILQTMANAPFSMLEQLHSSEESFLDRYMIGWPSWDTTAAMVRSLASVVKVTSILGSKIFITSLL